jgi:hypothetical protein
MMRLGNLAGSLAFAAIAGLATVAYTLIAPPLLGFTTAWLWWCLLLTAGYLVVIAPSLGRGIRIGMLSAAIGVGIHMLAPGSAAAMLGMTVLLGLMRSGFLFPRRLARALAVELGLGSVAGVLAGALAGPSSLSLGIAVWGFFLVQSLFFVIGGLEVGAPAVTEGAFEKAHRQAVTLMEDLPT